MELKMRLEDAMVYVIATAGYGMTTRRIAGLSTERNSMCGPMEIRHRQAGLCRCIRNPQTFVKEGGRILFAM